MNNKNVLISGAGIAGTTLAFWLKRFDLTRPLLNTDRNYGKVDMQLILWVQDLMSPKKWV